VIVRLSNLLNRFVQMGAYQRSGRSVVIGDTWRFGYRADGLRELKEQLSPVVALGGDEGAGGSVRTEYLYDGQMPVCEQEYEDGVLQQTRVNFLGARGIEAVVAISHTRGNQASLRWLLYDGHGNLMRTMAPDYTLSAFQWRGVWGEVQSSLGVGRGYCANLGHSEDETGLVYMRARYYEPATGRFISEDPARDGMNWYLYADGNPVNRVDYEGKSPALDRANLVFEFLEFLKKWGFPIPDPIMAAGRLFGAALLLGTVAGGALKVTFLAYAALTAGGLTVAATIGVGLAISFMIFTIGLCFALAIAEGVDFASDPDLYAQGGSTFGRGR